MECEAVIVGTVAFDRILNQKFSPPAVQLAPFDDELQEHAVVHIHHGSQPTRLYRHLLIPPLARV
jgi:hypothetical protein